MTTKKPSILHKTCKGCNKGFTTTWPKIIRCKKCRDKISNLNNRHNITEEYYNILFIKQNYVCKICNKPERVYRNNKLLKLSVDHCHKTGKIRGLLCNNCNRGLGFFNDSSDLLRSASYYLENNNEK